MEAVKTKPKELELPVPTRAKFFQEDNGNLSSMRLMCFVSLIASILFGILTIYTENKDGIIVTFGFLLGAFAPKAIQKFAEQKVATRKDG